MIVGTATFVAGAWQGFSDVSAIAIVAAGITVMHLLKN